MKRALVQLHLWCGLVIGVYAFVIGTTGAVLMFRPELQGAVYPQLLPAPTPTTPVASPDAVVAELRNHFPDHSFSGIDYPTYRRGTLLAYVTKGDEFRAVFLDPGTGRVVGELPKSGWVQRLQDLHFYLWAGTPGLTLNGVGGLCLLVMVVTGAAIAWPGASMWPQALWVDWRHGWKRVMWELHRAVGSWALLLLAMWAATGAYFAFPRPVRALVELVLPVRRSDDSRIAAHAAGGTPPSLQELVARARRELPSARVARVLVPFAPGGTYAVAMAREVHGDWDGSDEVTLHFDATGTLVRVADARQRSSGERVLSWLGLLHVGNFGGWPLKVVWAVFALALPTLFASGYVMWWNRVVRPAVRRRQE